jgi:hypothetical protein
MGLGPDINSTNENDETIVDGAVGVKDPVTGIEANVILEDNLNKLVVKASTVPDTLGNLKFTNATNGGSPDLNVNGAGTPVEFTVDAPVAVGTDLIISELVFEAFDGGIKIDKFLGQNAELTNGIEVEITSNGVMSAFNTIKATGEFNSHFALGNGGDFTLIFASGSDFMSAKFSTQSPFKLVGGSGDKVLIRINDNISSVGEIHFQIFGTEVTA